MKVCSKCKKEKELSLFSKQKKGKNGLHSYCKSCEKEYRENNKEKLNEYFKEYYENNKEKLNEYFKEYYENNKEKHKEYCKEYRENNKEKHKEYRKEYYENNKEKIKEKHKEYRKEYYENNKEKIKEYRKGYLKEYTKQRKKTDTLFKLRCTIRSLICTSIKKQGYTKQSKTCKILGCTYEEFKIHLENQFTDGMTWENQGEWHLDHIYPVSLAKDEEELIKLNHYTNFQPLWAEDNRKKSNKIIQKKRTD